ncbi:APC family permease [Gordonia aichiensis]|uniref:Putative amino acid transporter n=1 Tax=Gordonia aichiensis NBRC 108223 TaxID=1220583 RepID=L7KSX7_9ACTN|nr:APC family permease [Gordonia aichiensis]GAC51047.1 putative amino acid transporter [Gordonia aichiensis NBRC 108223]
MTESLTPTNTSADPPVTGALKTESAGTTHIVAMVVAAAAPIASAVSLIPLGMLLGNGVGMPGTIVLVTLILALFSVGFVRILPFIKNAGAFYAYVTAGLGRPAGLASAYVLSLVYISLGASVVAGFSYFATDLLQHFFHLTVPWALVAIVGVVVATALAVIGVTMTARVLFAVLACELAALVVLDISIVAHNGFPAFTWQVFSPSHIFSGAVGVAAIYAFSMFLGFEGTAIYAEEARNPQRTVPRATFIVVALIGLFYTFTSWAMVAATGPDKLVPTISNNPGAFVFGLSDQYVGTTWTDVIMVLNCCSLFAGILAFQNAGARYLYALARDDMMPRAFAKTHSKAGTPTIGLVTIAAIFVILSVIYSVAKLDPLLEMATSLVGLGTIGLVGMLTVASLSIAFFFIRRGTVGLATVGAPITAAILLGLCTFAGIENYDALTGVTTWWINNLAWILLPVAALGLVYAFWVRSRHSARYEAIGQTRV